MGHCEPPAHQTDLGDQTEGLSLILMGGYLINWAAIKARDATNRQRIADSAQEQAQEC